MQNLPLYDERALLLKVAEGDEAAFKQLFLYWHQLLAGYIFRITESRELTEEIVQDVFMKIWMVRETVAEIHNLKYFLLVVSRNQTFDALKKLLKEEKLKRAWEKENRGVLFVENGGQETQTRDSLIDQAIDNLPPRRKEVYLLSRHERLTYKEIAVRLGISKESVKTHLKLAARSISGFIRSKLLQLAVLTIHLLKIF